MLKQPYYVTFRDACILVTLTNHPTYACVVITLILKLTVQALLHVYICKTIGCTKSNILESLRNFHLI